MKGQHCVVTGASGGIGEAIASTLLERGAEVTLVARTGQRLEAAAERLRGGTTSDRVHTLGADLALQREVRRVAQVLAKRPVDALILNAALLAPERRLTAEGIEETLAVNHLAPYLLTRLLVPHFGRGARVVVVGADPKMLSLQPVDLEDLGYEHDFSPTRAYMRSKNMNAMFTYALARRLEPRGITVNAAHPGVIRTSLARDARGMAGVLFKAMRPFLPSPKTGADTPAWLAWSNDLRDTTGQFFVKRRAVSTAAHTRELERQEALWQASAELVGLEA